MLWQFLSPKFAEELSSNYIYRVDKNGQNHSSATFSLEILSGQKLHFYFNSFNPSVAILEFWQ
jgi:hypothetical protein